MSRTRTGGCLCGAVRYTVRGEPLHVGRCHCADCRKRSGSAYSIYGQWPLDAFESTGEYATYDRRQLLPALRIAPLSPRSRRTVEIQLGSLDDAPFELLPQAEIWIERREPWIDPVEGASQHRGNRR